jgi:hypothetical protein
MRRQALRNKQIEDLKFKRQVPLDGPCLCRGS